MGDRSLLHGVLFCYDRSTMHNLSLGKWGEDEAVEYLKKKGHRIVERNFKARYDEIDIIALDHNTLVFVEVKTRIGDAYGLPEESITKRKLHSLTRAAYYYQHLHPELSTALRIDAITVYFSPDERIEKINHYENITG